MLSGEVTLPLFFVASHINWGHLIKERICFYQRKVFPLIEDLIFRGLHPPGKETGSHENGLSFEGMVEKDRGVPIYLKPGLNLEVLLQWPVLRLVYLKTTVFW